MDGTGEVSGTIPATISRLTALEALYLSMNKLSGTLPPTLPHSLHHLFLDGNFISGSIPLSYCSIPAVVDLSIGSNPFTGAFPDCVGDLGGSVTTLFIDGTHLEGTLPIGIAALTGLVQMAVDTNSMSGTIPDVFDNMPHLVELFVGTNKLSGTLPRSMSDAQSTSKMSRLHTAVTSISGTFPRFVGADLTMLDFEETLISGTIGPEIGAYTNLKQLFLAGTLLSGTIPAELGERCLSFTDMDLSYTDVSGTVPSSFGKMQNLTDLMIAGMQVTGVGVGFCDIASNFRAEGTFCILAPNAMWTDGSKCPRCLNGDTLPITQCAAPSAVYCTADVAPPTPYPTAFATPQPTATPGGGVPAGGGGASVSPEAWVEEHTTLIGFAAIQFVLLGCCCGGVLLYALFAKKQRVWPFHRRGAARLNLHKANEWAEDFEGNEGLLLRCALIFSFLSLSRDTSAHRFFSLSYVPLVLLSSDYATASSGGSVSSEVLGSGNWMGRSVLRPNVDGRFDLSGPFNAQSWGGKLTFVDIGDVGSSMVSETSDFVPATNGGVSDFTDSRSSSAWNSRRTSRDAGHDGRAGDDELSMSSSMDSMSGGSMADSSMPSRPGPGGGSSDGMYTTVSADKSGKPRYTTTLDSTALSIVAAQTRLDRDTAMEHSAMLASHSAARGNEPRESAGAGAPALESDLTDRSPEGSPEGSPGVSPRGTP